MVSLGCALIQYDRCFNKKRRLRHRRAQREDHMKTQREDGIYKPRREASEETNPADTSISNIWPPELWENIFLLFKSLSICYVSPIKLHIYSPTNLQPKCSNWSSSTFPHLTISLSPSLTGSYMICGLWLSVFAIMTPLHRLLFTPCLYLDPAHIPHPLKISSRASQMDAFLLALYIFTAYSNSILPFPFLLHFVGGVISKLFK